jgi:phosphate:Na+ symporter
MNFEPITLILAALVLFLFALQSLCHELELKFKEQLKSILGKVSRHPFMALLLGAFSTTVLQSSSAVSGLCVSLVNGGMLTFADAFVLLLGSNIGTTMTSQLVALNIGDVAPFFLILGFFLNYLPGKLGTIGKPVFYFGLLFFGLNMLSEGLSVFKTHPLIYALLRTEASPYWGLGVGFILTILFQSSSVTSGLVVVLATEGLLQIDFAIPILIGANIGTTSTAILVSLPLGMDARRTALGNFIINATGALIFVPILPFFTSFIDMSTSNLAQKVVNAHISFNIVTVLFLYPLRNVVISFLVKNIK